MGRLYNKQSSLILKKEIFVFWLNILHPPYTMLRNNRTITLTNIDVLLKNGQGWGERRNKREKSSSLSNTFDDDCRPRSCAVEQDFYWNFLVNFTCFLFCFCRCCCCSFAGSSQANELNANSSFAIFSPNLTLYSFQEKWVGCEKRVRKTHPTT